MRLFTSFFRVFVYIKARLEYKRRIASFFGISVKAVDGLYREICDSQFMLDIVNKSGIKKSFFSLNMSMALRAPTLYVICRIVKPEIIVETGVAEGFSSAFILKALEDNGKGRLYSIDLPNQPGQELSGQRTTGWLVPEGLRKRWDMTLGSSKEKLPPLMDNLKNIDIFYHDSDHSYENMMFEFEEVLPYITENGMIISDDITDNSAFDDFCRRENLYPLKLFKTGITGKNV